MEENDGIIIFTKGLNGKTVFSVYTENKRIPILTEKPLRKISEEFVRLYPDKAEKICRFYNQVFCGSFPQNVNISHLEPSQRENLLREISKEYKKIENKRV